MRRRPLALLFKLTAAILAGAVVTCAVAWGAVFWGAEPQKDFVTDHAGDGRWPIQASSTWGQPQRSGGGKTSLTTWGFWSNRNTRVMTSDFGWPMRAMIGIIASHDGGEGFVVEVNTWAVRPNWIPVRNEAARVPTKILPLGFAVNTTLSALVLLAAVECAGIAWRRMRAPRCR